MNSSSSSSFKILKEDMDEMMANIQKSLFEKFKNDAIKLKADQDLRNGIPSEEPMQGISSAWALKTRRKVNADNFGYRSWHIEDVTSILNLEVKFDHQRRKNRISQCYNCQKFGHRAANCHAEAVCRHCAENHGSRQRMKQGHLNVPIVMETIEPIMEVVQNLHSRKEGIKNKEEFQGLKDPKDKRGTTTIYSKRKWTCTKSIGRTSLSYGRAKRTHFEKIGISEYYIGKKHSRTYRTICK
ncbi:hypothetical protein JTB14_005481 [Gonioctena quinquepunctata]|nr:hypothetical protein JTB14_005481 [Gonioctena quinquepunctata]